MVGGDQEQGAPLEQGTAPTLGQGFLDGAGFGGSNRGEACQQLVSGDSHDLESATIDVLRVFGRANIPRDPRKMTGYVYLNGATLMTTPTQRLVEIARETGYAGIEARAERLLKDAAEVRSTAQTVRPREVVTLNGVALTVRADGRMDRRLIEDDLKPRLQICQELDAPYLLAIPPRAPGLETRRAIPPTRDALELARERADRLGIRIGFEFLGFGDCPINTPEIATETVDGIEAIDLVLDSCHWHASGSQPLNSFPVDRLALVHLNDAPDKPPREIEDADRVLPGEGVIQLKTLLAALKARGYSGPWSLETFNPNYWKQDPDDIARRGHAAIDMLL
jgi:2-keto-myo-inositol isomerase